MPTRYVMPVLGLIRAMSLIALSIAATAANAAALPPHPPLRILIVSDEVNPHGLSDAELSQPGDISAALLAPGSGLNLDTAGDAVLEVATDDISLATAALSLPISDPSAYDVVIYFAHRIPSGGSGAADQEAFVVAVEDFLTAGGGFISFHHGAYRTTGKDSIQEIIGATAMGSVPWNTVEGQNVINVAPGHFVSSNEIEYASSTSYADPLRGVPAGTYDLFNNTPDERYLDFEINPTAGDVTLLFASNYDQSGTTHLLGLLHERPAWEGVVVVYQPGEYQPNALDDLDGNNFQILANAIHFAAYRDPESAVPSLMPAGLWMLGAALSALGSRVLRKHSSAGSLEAARLSGSLGAEVRNLESHRKSD